MSSRLPRKKEPLLPSNRIFNGSCLDILRTFADCCCDSVVTDPPYGLGSKEPSVEEIIAFLQGADLDTGGDFMQNDWEIPSVSVWRELHRVLKPGGHVLSFGGTRTWDLISIGARAAGFQYRDTLPDIFPDMPGFMWLNAQGRAKMSGLSKKVEGSWEGWDTALKPTWEPILLFRKLPEGSAAENLTKWGTGALNIDGTRVFTDWNESDRPDSWKRSGHTSKPGAKKIASPKGQGINLHPLGRWPTNTLFVHSPSCTETDDLSGCTPECPVLRLTEKNARYFPRFHPFRYVSKVSTKEATLDGELENEHSTKKPVELMRWLVRLVTPPQGIVLDPYCGSGSTLHAAIEEGFRFCGIELDPKHFATSVRRAKLISARCGRIWQQAGGSP